MKVILNYNGRKIDITEVIEDVSISGDLQQASRKAEITIYNPAHDNIQPQFNPKIGNVIQIYEDNIEIFRGVVFTRDKNSKNANTRLTIYDYLIYTLKNQGYYNFKSLTPKAITERVCNDFNIPIGKLSDPYIKISYVANAKSIYDIIMTAYTKASRENGKKYYPVMVEGKLYVIEKGSQINGFTLSEDYIDSVTKNDSIESMVNSVLVMDNDGKVVASASNTSWQNAFGKLQAIINPQDGQDNNAIAERTLSGIETKMEINCLGNIFLRTGYSIKVNFPYLNINGLLYIESDNHSWKSGIYTTRINVSYKNVMDEVDQK